MPKMTLRRILQSGVSTLTDQLQGRPSSHDLLQDGCVEHMLWQQQEEQRH